MKKQLLLFFFLIIGQLILSQNSQDPQKAITINEILNKQPSDYFELQKLITIGSDMPIDSLIELEKRSKQEKYLIGQMFALQHKGLHYRDKRDYVSALKNLDEALKLAEKSNNESLRLIFSNNIGHNYKKQFDIKNALVYYQYALSEGKKIKNPTAENKKSISVAENNIGNIYLKIHQYDLAIEKFTSALKAQEGIDDIDGLAINHQNIGTALEKQNEIDLALDYYLKSLAYNTENNNELGELICNNSIIGVLVKQGKSDEAYKIAKKNYKKLKKLSLNNQYYHVQTTNNLGLVYLKLKKYKKALFFLEESVKIAKEYNYKEYEIEAYYYLSELHDLLNNKEKAFFYYKKATKWDKKISGEESTLYINNLVHRQDVKAKLEEIKSYKEIAQESTHQISRSRNVLIITLVSLALLSVALYSIYRQRLLNNDKKVLTLEQQALQAQMNPHFIFNALNSIKLYIINNDQKQAVYYLNKFSKLIRNILDVSKTKEVSLKEELNTMGLYMSIENIRFNDEINYIQKINSSLNLETIKVPPLVLQPFLENAIWHGLSSKEGTKNVVLSAFKVSKNLIEISISDNGIGRKAASEIKKKKSLNRKSIGIDLTIERLKTFSNEMMHEFSVKYYDLTDDDGNPEGTKVALRIPLV